MKKIWLICIILCLTLLVGCLKESKPEAKSQIGIEKTNISQIIGVWNLVKQYSWNSETQQWDPGLLLEDGTATEFVTPPVLTEIKKGILYKELCPSEDETKAEYITIDNVCWKVTDNKLEGIGQPGSEGAANAEWKLEGNNLEIIVVFTDVSGNELARGKAIYER